MKRIRMYTLLATAVLAAGLVASSAVAKGPGGGPGGGGPGGGGGGGGGEETAANNLSVPAIFVPDTTGAPTLNFACGDAVAPSGNTTNFPAPPPPAPAGDYYLQGVNQWQAECTTAAVDSVQATADWGDNLTSAPLKAGTPIRTEIGFLVNAPAAMTGYTVYKLTDELDRLATYGTMGVAENPYPEVRAWDASTHLKIERDDGFVVYDGLFGAEINSTGRVVYGYNWQKPLAGDYTITVTALNVDITAKAAGDNGTVVDVDTVTIDVHVAEKGGGGSSGGGGADIDGDGIANNVDNCPAVYNPDQADADGDGKGDLCEEEEELDTDGDGLTDTEEQALGTHPRKADSDRDGLGDYSEARIYGTNPRSADTDKDGLRDGDEFVHGTDPLNPDTDGDGAKDGREVRKGQDPLN